eukprot:snap_masked-scaffold_15-processed-gene-8.50-mRNA-1 protein AED:0.15 eAED:1.00 QI:0/-1/0/1/-1/1/1/0/344
MNKEKKKISKDKKQVKQKKKKAKISLLSKQESIGIEAEPYKDGEILTTGRKRTKTQLSKKGKKSTVLTNQSSNTKISLPSRVQSSENPTQQVSINVSEKEVTTEKKFLRIPDAEAELPVERFNITFGIVSSLLFVLFLVMGYSAMIITINNQQNEAAQNLFCLESSVEKLPEIECVHKRFCFFVSCVLLAPYIMEGILGANLFVGGRLKTLEKAQDILEEVHDWTFWETLRNTVFSLGYLLSCIIIAFPLLFLLPWSQDARDIWKAFPFVVPALLVNLSLMPFSFILIFSAEHPAETMVDAMGIQVLAGAANVFVRQVFKPENQLAATLSLFFPTFNFYNIKTE